MSPVAYCGGSSHDHAALIAWQRTATGQSDHARRSPHGCDRAVLTSDDRIGCRSFCVRPSFQSSAERHGWLVSDEDDYGIGEVDVTVPSVNSKAQVVHAQVVYKQLADSVRIARVGERSLEPAPNQTHACKTAS
jgi:hypothetical protein